MPKFLDPANVPILSSLPSSGNTGDIIYQGGSFYGRNASAWYSLSNNFATKSDVGLGNVDNTSDTNKPVSTAQQSALNLKVSTGSITTGGATMNTATVLGRTTASSGAIEELSYTTLTGLLSTFTSSAKGLVPASGGGTTTFLRADGTWAAASGGGGGTTTNKLTIQSGGAGAASGAQFDGSAAITISTNTIGATPTSVATYVTPSSRAWAPTDLTTGLVVGWWDAAQTSSLTTSSGAVSEWKSRVSGITSTQTIGTNQPTYSATALNSKPGLTFSGNQFLNLSSVTPFMTGKQDGTVFIVAKPTAANAYIFSYGGNAPYTSHAFATDSNGYAYFDVTNVGVAVSSPVWNGNTRIVSFSTTGGCAGIAVDVDGSTGTNTYTIATNMDTYLGGSIGRWAVYGAYFTGIIQEILVVSGSVSAAEMDMVEGYLAAKWGLQANLPSGHTYKSSAPVITPAAYSTVIGNGGANPVELAGTSLRVTNGATVSGNLIANNISGINTGDQTIWLTGDVIGSGTGTFNTALAAVNSNVGTFGSTTTIPQITVNAKGLITAVATIATPSFGANTFTGKQTLPATTTSAASLTIPSGTTPSSPTSGDIWNDGANLYFRASASNVSLGGNWMDLGINTLYINNNPGTPTQGVRIYGIRRANRHMIGWITPTGRTERVSPWLGSNNRVEAYAVWGATTVNSFGTSWTIAAGTAAAQTYATTNYLTTQRRSQQTTGTSTAGTLIENYGPLMCSRNPGNGGGGFHMSFRFGVIAVGSDSRWFCGLTSSASAMSNTNPSGLFNLVGFAKDSGDTSTFYMIANGGSGTAQKIALTNTGTISAAANAFFQVEIFVKSADTVFGYRVSRTSSAGVEVIDEGTITGTAGASGGIPADTTAFAPHLFATNVTAANAATYQFSQFFLETD